MKIGASKTCNNLLLNERHLGTKRKDHIIHNINIHMRATSMKSECNHEGVYSFVLFHRINTSHTKTIFLSKIVGTSLIPLGFKTGCKLEGSPDPSFITCDKATKQGSSRNHEKFF